MTPTLLVGSIADFTDFEVWFEGLGLSYTQLANKIR